MPDHPEEQEPTRAQEAPPGMFHEERLPGLPDVDTPAYREQQLSPREKVRWGILWFLGLLLVGGLIGYGLGAMYLPDDRWEDMAAFADNMGAVIGGLIGVAVGYYFQSSSRE